MRLDSRAPPTTNGSRPGIRVHADDPWRSCAGRHPLAQHPSSIGPLLRGPPLKLAEALQLRADLQKRLLQMPRIAASARHQEGEAPPEDPNALLVDAERMASELEGLIRGINRTNVVTEIEPGLTMTDALAHRDVLGLRHAILNEAAQHASFRQDRYSKSEVGFVTPLDVAQLHRAADDLAESAVSWTRRSSRRTGKPTWPNEEDGRKLVAVLGTGRVPKVALPGGAAEGPAATGFESPSHAEAQQRAQAYGARINRAPPWR